MESTRPSAVLPCAEGAVVHSLDQAETHNYQGRGLKRTVSARKLSEIDSPSTKAPRKGLSEYCVSQFAPGRAKKAKWPDHCPQWLAGYKDSVFTPLANINKLKKEGQNKAFLELANGNSPLYNDLVVALLTLEEASAQAVISPNQQQVMAGMLDCVLEGFPHNWRRLPLVINSDVPGWSLPECSGHLAEKLESNEASYLTTLEVDSFVPCWHCKTVNGMELSQAYLLYDNLRKMPIVDGLQPVTADELFEQNPSLYQWLVAFRNRDKILSEGVISDVEYDAVVQILESTDKEIADFYESEGQACSLSWNSLEEREYVEQSVDDHSDHDSDVSSFSASNEDSQPPSPAMEEQGREVQATSDSSESDGDLPASSVPEQALPDECRLSWFGVARGSRQKIPDTCPDWLKDYEESVFSPLKEIRKLLVVDKEKADKQKDRLGLINSCSPHYNHLMVALMMLDKACMHCRLSQRQQGVIEGWLDEMLEDFPIQWRQLPLVLNPFISGWKLPRGCQHLEKQFRKNSDIYKESINIACFVAPWHCKRVNGFELGEVYLQYYNVRNENVKSVSGEPSLTADKLFEKKALLYDWLVFFQDKETILMESDLSELEYAAAVELFNSVDGDINKLDELEEKHRFCWCELEEKEEVEDRWNSSDSESDDDRGSVSDGGDSESTVDTYPVSSVDSTLVLAGSCELTAEFLRPSSLPLTDSSVVGDPESLTASIEESRQNIDVNAGSLKPQGPDAEDTDSAVTDNQPVDLPVVKHFAADLSSVATSPVEDISVIEPVSTDSLETTYPDLKSAISEAAAEILQKEKGRTAELPATTTVDDSSEEVSVGEEFVEVYTVSNPSTEVTETTTSEVTDSAAAEVEGQGEKKILTVGFFLERLEAKLKAAREHTMGGFVTGGVISDSTALSSTESSTELQVGQSSVRELMPADSEEKAGMTKKKTKAGKSGRRLSSPDVEKKEPVVMTVDKEGEERLKDKLLQKETYLQGREQVETYRQAAREHTMGDFATGGAISDSTALSSTESSTELQVEQSSVRELMPADSEEKAGMTKKKTKAGKSGRRLSSPDVEKKEPVVMTVDKEGEERLKDKLLQKETYLQGREQVETYRRKPLQEGEVYRFRHHIDSDSIKRMNKEHPVADLIYGDDGNLIEVDEIIDIMTPLQPDEIPSIESVLAATAATSEGCLHKKFNPSFRSYEVVLPVETVRFLGLYDGQETGDKVTLNAFVAARQMVETLRCVMNKYAASRTAQAGRELCQQIAILDDCFKALKWNVDALLPPRRSDKEADVHVLKTLEELSRLQHCVQTFARELVNRTDCRDDEGTAWRDVWPAAFAPLRRFHHGLLKPELVEKMEKNEKLPKENNMFLSSGMIKFFKGASPNCEEDKDTNEFVSVDYRFVARLLIQQIDVICKTYKNTKGVWNPDNASVHVKQVIQLIRELRVYCEGRLRERDSRRDLFLERKEELSFEEQRYMWAFKEERLGEKRYKNEIEPLKHCYAICGLLPELEAFAQALKTENHTVFLKELNSRRNEMKVSAYALKSWRPERKAGKRS